MKFYVVKSDSPRNFTQTIGPFPARWEAYMYIHENKLEETHKVVSNWEL